MSFSLFTPFFLVSIALVTNTLLTHHLRYCIASALTASGRYLVTGSEDHKVVIWDLQTREVIQLADSHKGMCFLAFANQLF